MHPRHPSLFATLLIGVCFLFGTRSSAQDISVYFGGSGLQEIYDVHVLKAPGSELDNSLLLAGGADSLEFLSEELVPASIRTEIPAVGLDGTVMRSTGNDRVGFIMQVSADLSRVIAFVHFPYGTARTISRIRTTTVTGDPTGELYVSGRTFVEEDGYAGTYRKYNNGLSAPAPRENTFIARLNRNFINGIPDACLYIHNTDNPYEYRNANDQVQAQPWDVNNRGEVIFGEGAPKIPLFGSSSYLKKLDPWGRLMPMPGWPMHFMKDGSIVYGPHPEGDINYSVIYGYQGRRGSLRSHSQEDYNLLGIDSNGFERRGKYPDDYFYSGSVDPVTAAGEPNDIVIASNANGTEISGLSAGPGRTGRVADHPRTYAWKAVVFDKRTNEFYVGYEVGYFWQAPPDISDKAGWEGRHEFDPTVVAMDTEGNLRFWDRFKQESNGDQPDTYVDALDIDYAGNLLVALGRQHGDGYFTSWRGNELNANPGATGFKNSLNGTTGNIHIQWLGKFRLSDFAIMHSTFIAEPITAATITNPYADPYYDGWQDQNAGQKTLNTTRVFSDAPSPMRVARDGTIAVVLYGQRVLTTSNAFQKTPKSGDPGANTFVRVYSPDLSRVLYSSLLVGANAAGKGDRNTELYAVNPMRGRVLVVGGHGGNLNPMPTANPTDLAWGTTTGSGTPDGVFASFGFPLVDYPEPSIVVDYPVIPAAPPPAFQAPRVVLPTIVPGQPVSLGFTAESGLSYRLQRKESLTDTSWTDVGAPVTGDGPTSVSDDAPLPVDAQSGFYRLVVEPVP